MKNLFIIILLFTSLCLWAQNVPQTIDYQGRLADIDGNYLNSVVTVYFLIYDTETGGTLLWNESQDVSCANGIFHVQLGSSVTFPTSLFDGVDRWLELTVSDETLSPRTAIASVPYSIKAETAYTLQNMGSGSGLDADLLDGQDSSDFMPATTDNWVNTSGDTMTGELIVQSNVGIGTVTPDANLHIEGSIKIVDGNQGASKVLTSDVDGAASWQTPPASGDITAVTAGTGLNGGGTSGDVTLNVDVPLNLTGSVEVPNSVIKAENTSNGYGYGVYGKNTSTGNYGYLGSYNRGVYGSNFANLGTGVYGNSNSSIGGYGVMGRDSSSDNFGLLGSNDYGVYGANSSGNYGYLGSSLEGVFGHNHETNGRGVYGEDQNSGNYGYLGSYSYAIYGRHDSSGNHGSIGTNDYGVYGRYSSGGNYGYLGGSTIGVFGRNYVNYGQGVHGINYGSSGQGVYGINYGNSGSGIFGYNSSVAGKAVCGHSTGYYGGYFTSSLYSGGTHVVHAEYTGTGGASYPIAVYGVATPDNNGNGFGGYFRGGSYGITCWGPDYAGYFSGNVTVTGTFSNPSDERFKENVQPFGNALSKIKLMNVHTFNFIQMADEKQLLFPEGEQIGLIAQELEKILPELVVDNVHNYNKNEGIEGTESDMEQVEYKGINYIGLIPVLIEAIKELQLQNEEQQIQINELLRTSGN